MKKRVSLFKYIFAILLADEKEIVHNILIDLKNCGNIDKKNKSVITYCVRL